MPSPKSENVPGSLEPLILVIRNQRVILDADLARLYRVTTKAFNQSVKRNAERFPEDFAFQVTVTEVIRVRSQTATSSSQATGMTGITQNRSQSVTGSQKHRDPRFRPWAFTEHGAVMVADIIPQRAICPYEPLRGQSLCPPTRASRRESSCSETAGRNRSHVA